MPASTDARARGLGVVISVVSLPAYAQEVPAEYRQVLTTLVVAIHHHMTSDRPMIIFLHYWATGPAEQLATGFKAAVNELGKHGGAASR